MKRSQNGRWLPGQTGNPERIRRPRSLNVKAMIEERFARKVSVSDGKGVQAKTAFEAIVQQIWLKAAKGQKKALRVWMRYHEYAASQGGIGGFELRFDPKPDDWDEQMADLKRHLAEQERQYARK